ncbi:DNA adenine methylase [Chlorobaculum parvum NCIB 8327]|uniref:Site-specific DNA-methyltransferase (adenine-specific) n=1 Tax=Chlorobaculum parvum (strain DSM 263 / NCIMB 8327) TaxID=517417 RepID=B3QL16_CHLP8|nr:Dam family site-specific DNA-(adenine-N6)-methyltransferase [Chlorobaculum parvum]ACF10804.1 DNA adenine methylase [Chlorobaculum parvum NCIB 8327]
MIKTEINKLRSFRQNTDSVPESVKPFIRWAGGKQNLVSKLSENLPKEKFCSYFEPFVGAGSLFFHNNFINSKLSDINPHLINSYISIRESAEEVSDRLAFYKERVSEEYYYKLRDVFNKRKNHFTIDQAAIFIFLVHTSFNGIYRVNKKGEYNVPFGKAKPAIPDSSHLLKIQSKLKGAIITNGMYEDILTNVKRNDFVYFDPPYPPLNETSFFQHYSIDKFPNKQQIELSEYARELSNLGSFVMISNAETPMIIKLYKDWNIKRVSAYRYVNCKAERKAVNELIITNY